MTADPTVLDRIFNRLVRALSAGSPDQLSAPFTVFEIVHALVPYRTYRAELGVDTIQDYEHALLELLAGERGLLVVAPDTVAAIRKELASPDPDTGMLHRLQQVEARLGAVRMPIVVDDRAQAPREEPAREAPVVRDVVLSDAAVIGAAMELEDAVMARAAEEARRPAAVVSAPPSPPAAPAGPLPSLADLTALVPAESSVTTPLQSVQGVTLANATTLSRITPLSTPSVYGDPIEFRGVRHAPVDIGGVIFLFGMIARELGFHVEAMSSGFPRCEAKRQLAPGKWARLRIDFELDSRHFRDAGRNPSAVDLIVCWRDTWPDRPASLDVLALDRTLPTLARD
jgi:hypothetical protein